MLWYRDLPAHTSEVLDLTSLTVDEFTALVPPFEEAFLGYMADWTLHGRRRQARHYTTYKNCPLPTPEDRLLFMLVYLKQHPTQLLHGRLFGMRQSNAMQWIHVLLPVLRNTLRALGDAPVVVWRPCANAWGWNYHTYRKSRHPQKRVDPPHPHWLPFLS